MLKLIHVPDMYCYNLKGPHKIEKEVVILPVIVDKLRSTITPTYYFFKIAVLYQYFVNEIGTSPAAAVYTFHKPSIKTLCCE